MSQRLKTDWILFVTIACMVAFGLVMVYSASSVMADLVYKASYYFALRQVLWAVGSFIALMYFMKKDYRLMRDPLWAFASLGVVIAMLVVVYFVDPKSHRWFRLGSVGLQPSEFAKPALILFLAWFVTLRSRAINTKHTVLPATLALVALAATVVVADLGTAVVLVLTAAVVFYVAGLQRRYFVVALAMALVFASAAVLWKPYRLARIIAFVDPGYTMLEKLDPSGRTKRYMNESATRDTSYQARQSKIAVGSGGAFGLGLMRGKQKILYLPEAHTDFIYAVVSEELGFFGASAILAGFLIIIWRGLTLCWSVQDDFGRMLALGVTACIAIQALINISVVLDMGPTKGIPLPMISAGGSSLLSTLICLGMLLSVSEHSA
jgi:cell division protein FtsW